MLSVKIMTKNGGGKSDYFPFAEITQKRYNLLMFLTKLNEVLASKKSFISDRLNVVSLGLTLLVNIIHWGILYGKIKPGSANVLLHYNVVYGPDLVDKASFIYLIPAVALAFIVINAIISNVFYRREKVASYFLNFAGIPVQLIFLIATLVLIKVNE